MSLYYQNTKESVDQLFENYQFDSCWKENEDNNGGFIALIRCSEDAYHKIKCFIDCEKEIVYFIVSLPVEENGFGHMNNYMDCVNEANIIKSKLMIGEWFQIEFHQSVSYSKRFLVEDELTDILTNILEEADLFFPVFIALEQNDTIPTDSGEASRMYYEVYMRTEKYATTEQILIKEREKEKRIRRIADERIDHNLEIILGEALGIRTEENYVLRKDNKNSLEKYLEIKKKEFLFRFNELSKQEQEILCYRYGFIDGVHHTISKTAEHFGCSYNDVKYLIQHMVNNRHRCYHHHHRKLKDFLEEDENSFDKTN